MNAIVPRVVALVGAGVIGRGWIRVFAPHGTEVRVYDSNSAQISQTLDWLAQDLAADVAPDAPWAWDARTVADAAFLRYLRDASDFAGGRRTEP